MGIGFEDGLDDLEFAEHSGSEQIEAGSVVEEELGDIASSHVGGSTEGRFEIATSPIPGRVYEGGLGFQQGAGFVEVLVGGCDKIFDTRGIERGRSFGYGRKRVELCIISV